MDINGLVNHTSDHGIRPGSLSPPDQSGPEFARSHIQVAPARMYIAPNLAQSREQKEIYSSCHYRDSMEHLSSTLNKRSLDAAPLSHPYPPTKRRVTQLSLENRKIFPPRRRAIQACEACRSKKSKCDNERPSCGSCIQHGIECVYRNAPVVPLYGPWIHSCGLLLDSMPHPWSCWKSLINLKPRC